MNKTSGQLEQEFIENLKKETGLDLINWIDEINKTGIEKRNDIVKWLKTEMNFGHMNATFLTGIYLNNGKPVYGNEADLLENQLSKYENWRTLYESVSKRILDQFPEAQIIPKKTYISFTSKREFTAINIKSKEIRLGMDLGDEPFKGTIEKAKLTGPMPRISHMVVLREESDLSEPITKALERSFQRVN